jgi:hypothetical protein
MKTSKETPQQKSITRESIENTLSDKERIKCTASVQYAPPGHYDEYVIIFSYLKEKEAEQYLDEIEQVLKNELGDEWSIMNRGNRIELNFVKKGEVKFSRNDEELLKAFEKIEKDRFILPNLVS